MNIGTVTVVIPVYKTEKYLDRCISSIVGQTYRDLDILLIDDGSPDSCPEKCDGWARRDDRIRVIHKQNEGLGMARNTGIDHARGEYICFFDSDDYVDVHLVEKAYRLAKEHGADLVTFGFTYMDGNGTCIGTGIPKHGLEGVSSCTRLFSLKLLREHQIRYPSERRLISEDGYAKYLWEIHVQKAVCLPEPLYYYCRNPESLSRVYRPDRYEKGVCFCKACMELLQKQNRVEEKREELLEWFVANAIASMKQTVQTDTLTAKQKRKIFRDITEDEAMQQAASQLQGKEENIRRRLFAAAVRSRQYHPIFLMVWLQTRSRNSWR